MRLSAALILAISFPIFAGAAHAQVPTEKNALRANTKLITVDVVATDSHGNVVGGLTESDFKVYEDRNVRQDIAHFRFVDARSMQQLGSSKSNATPGVFSNLNSASGPVAPTAILMDALNTGMQQQMQVRRDMLLYLNKLPADTPVAVFLLEHKLHMVQNFTTNPATLRAALQKAVANTAPKEKNPEFDANSLSNVLLDEGVDPSKVKILEQFEKGQYEEATQQRAQETADAMRDIANYLRGYPGRKNLIWFSEAFPISIMPNSDFGLNPFFGTGSYRSEVQAAAASLMEAGVAVYPVDARGMETSQVDMAESKLPSNKLNPENNPGGFGDTLRDEDEARANSQTTLQQMAYETGGRICENTSDLAGCVFRALHEDSSYYEISYYPTDLEWDNKFHRISIKTSVHDVRLDYRRGFIATDSAVLVQHENAVELLQDACRDPLPSTTIGMSVTALPPTGSGPSAKPRYLLKISPNALTFEPEGQSLRIDVQMAICEFDPQGNKFVLNMKDLSQSAPEAKFRSWKENGIRDIFVYGAKPEDQRLRFAVVDLPSGETGSVNVPAHPKEFGSLPPGASAKPVVGAAAVQSSAPAVVAQPSAPAVSAPSPAPAASGNAAQSTQLVFQMPSGKSGTLDWSGDKIIYRGSVGAEFSAPMFFNGELGSQFRCQAGKLTPTGPNGGPPKLVFPFRNPSGSIAIVDLSGPAPVYSGSLAVDPSAKAFFESLWKLCHCEAP
ncbi:MAG: VWA domain-containing protein [Candidatus Acidiferrales bacterium]